MRKKTINVVCAIITNNNKILSVKRNDKGEVGLKWEFPGGKIESGESMEQAIIREIKEELNCNIKVVKYLGNVYHEYQGFNIILNAFLCKMKDGKLELKEHIDLCWCNKEDLINLDFAEADLKLISHITI